MKKIFTLIAVLAAWLGASAQGSASYDFTASEEFATWGTQYGAHELTYPEAVVKFANANRQTGTALITNMPVTKGNPVTVEMTNGMVLTSAKITCAQWGSKTQTITAQASFDGEEFAPIEGFSSTDFVLDVTAVPAGTKAVKFVFNSQSNQVGIQQIDITFEAPDGDFVAMPTFSPVSGSIVDPYSTVTISCATEGADIYYTLDKTEPTAASTKYTTPIEIEDYTYIKAIAIKGETTSEVAEAWYKVVPMVESLSDVYDFEDGTPYYMMCTLTVVYQSGKYTYVTDGLSYALMFDANSTFEMAAGTQIMMGWKGKVNYYKGLLQLIADDFSALEADGTAPIPQPTEVDAALAATYMQNYNANMSRYVKMMGVTFEEGSLVGKMGEGDDAIEVTFYNRFGLETIPAGTYNVTGFVSVFDTTPQIYYTAFEEANPEEGTNVYAVGDFNDWDVENPAVFTYDEGANYYYLSIEQEVASLKLSTAKGTWDAFNAAAFAPVEALENGVWTDFAASTSNINMPWTGVYTIYVNLDSEMMRVNTDTPEPQQVDVYLRGGMNGWGAVDAYKFATTDGENYTLADVTIAAGVEFKIADANWGAVNYGGVLNMEANTEYTLVSGGSNCTVAGDFTGSIEFNVKTGVIKFVGEMTGIEGVAADSAAAVYYNLQGIKVANPTPGTVVIRIQGDKATKVIY